jgi:hypothetical protein
MVLHRVVEQRGRDDIDVRDFIVGDDPDRGPQHVVG